VAAHASLFHLPFSIAKPNVGPSSISLSASCLIFRACSSLPSTSALCVHGAFHLCLYLERPYSESFGSILLSRCMHVTALLESRAYGREIWLNMIDF
jgi:hypothetical protein